MNSIHISCSRAAGLAVCMISLALPMAAQSHVHYSRSELRKMMQEANTAEQVKTLATWFRAEEASFRTKAEMENRDHERYKKQMMPAKFPTPADTARRLADYYSYEADQKAALATRYESQLARLDPSYRLTPEGAPAVAPVGTGAVAPASLSQNEKMLLDRIQQLEQQVVRPRTK